MITYKEEIIDNQMKKNTYFSLLHLESKYHLCIHINCKQLSQICISEHREHSHTKLQRNSSKFQNPSFILELPTYRVLL